MELKDFVSETIKQIIDGVSTAQEHAASKGARVSPNVDYHSGKVAIIDSISQQPVQNIDFDVAVTASNEAKTQGGVAVFGAAFGLASKGQSERSNEVINRIRFSIPIVLP